MSKGISGVFRKAVYGADSERARRVSGVAGAPCIGIRCTATPRPTLKASAANWASGRPSPGPISSKTNTGSTRCSLLWLYLRSFRLHGSGHAATRLTCPISYEKEFAPSLPAVNLAFVPFREDYVDQRKNFIRHRSIRVGCRGFTGVSARDQCAAREIARRCVGPWLPALRTSLAGTSAGRAVRPAA